MIINMPSNLMLSMTFTGKLVSSSGNVSMDGTEMNYFHIHHNKIIECKGEEYGNI